MQRTKAQIESSFVFEQDQISTQSYYLGMLSTIGLDIQEMFSYTDNMNKINAKDVAEVAMKYLDFSKSNSVELVPQDI
jgi:zinc protease